MSLSIYYTARRPKSLTAKESEVIQSLVNRYSVESQIAERERTSEGPDWSSFFIYDPENPTEPGVIFEGATQLPVNSEDHLWLGLQHWCALLSEIRRAVPDAGWAVHVEDHEIPWDEEREEYDPSS